MEQVNPELQLLCDFVNTLDVESGGDELDGWLRARGLWTRRSGLDELEAARDVREALRDLMRANNGCEADPDASAAVLDTAARGAGVTVRFDRDGVRLDAPAGGIGRVLAAAGQAMADGSWLRLKACRADTCRWAFVDSARNRSRQWCSMEVCGNREKARAFRERRRRA
ncbi:MAG TPA: CGNR zinc finger domain-containing protein [Gaiellaceae bacterium]|nr:CGNR zinc finger domain-containing protein [Gaiellaceae bacterium]